VQNSAIEVFWFWNKTTCRTSQTNRRPTACRPLMSPNLV